LRTKLGLIDGIHLNLDQVIKHSNWNSLAVCE
jgi:hypothetical protein